MVVERVQCSCSSESVHGTRRHNGRAHSSSIQTNDPQDPSMASRYFHMAHPFFQEMTKKIEENLRLSADAQDALARAKQAEKDLEEQVQHNARLEERLESARLDVARCQEAVAAAEAKAKRCESVSAELEAELRLLRQDVTKAEQRLQALSDDLAESNDRVDKARTRVREMEKVTYYARCGRRELLFGKGVVLPVSLLV